MIVATQKLTRAQTKQHNKALILKTIYDQREVSRADLARSTHLTRPTVSSVVSELIGEGLVAEIGYGPSEGGKPPILLSVVDNSRHLIGIDLANSEFRGAVVDLRGNVIERRSLPVGERDGKAALDLVFQLADELTALATSPILGIGIGTPGLMDPEAGLVRQAVNLEWRDLPLRKLLVDRYHVPVYIANDSQVAALGEYVFGRAADIPNLVVVKVGRGVGAGIVLNGKLHYGDGFGAGEVGHIRVVDNGRLCRCGNYGCLETVASSQVLVREVRTLLQRSPQSPLHKHLNATAPITTDMILEAFHAGGDEIRAVVENMGRHMGKAVANLVGILNIQHILIGGSLARFGDALIAPACLEMHERVQKAQARETTLAAANLGTDIVILGAAALLLTNELALV
jgi:glucokinase-like ROK family protein